MAALQKYTPRQNGQEETAGTQRRDSTGKPEGELVAVRQPRLARHYQPKPRRSRKGRSVNASMAPNGQAWSDLFMEADEWENAGTYVGRGDNSHRSQPRPWPALPPPDGPKTKNQVNWRYTLAGIALVGTMCALIAG